MKWLFRPSTVVGISAVLAFIAGGLLWWPLGESATAGHAIVKHLSSGDHEIVWLNAATNAVAWERFVAGVYRLQADRPELQLQLDSAADPFPAQTAQTPELAVTFRGCPGRIWIRWYKCTSDLGAGDWVRALASRERPPLAIIGGGSTDRARDLAKELNDCRDQFSSAPLLLITTATADKIASPGGVQDLMRIYEDRAFRFCFKNSQMAEAVIDFIWSQDDLRPDAPPYFLAQWKDDPYSQDLFDQFHDVLTERLQQNHTLMEVARDWSWSLGWMMTGGFPGELDLDTVHSRLLPRPTPIWGTDISYSVGTFTLPNHRETDAADKILSGLDLNPRQRRPLLVLPATAPPARRLLHALIRSAPLEAGRFIVATGAAIDFNTVYRDRLLAWPILDLPVPLVFFCHRNPVDPMAFQPAEGTAPPDSLGKSSTGTQDLLLYRDIMDTVLDAMSDNSGKPPSADGMADYLRSLVNPDGQSRFDTQGDQRGGSGEYIVCLRPDRMAARVAPKARLQVWNRVARADGRRAWQPVTIAGLPELIVPYAPNIDNGPSENGK